MNVNKTKSVALPSTEPKPSGEVPVNFGNAEMLKLRLLNEINITLKKVLEKLDGR